MQGGKKYTMNGNLLLRYLSEVGEGHWARFTSALDTLEATWGRSTHARQLSMLGHVEFDFWHKPRIRWAVCQPTLAWLPESSSQIHRTVLCGRRTQKLLNVLHEQAQLLNCTIEIHPQQNNPNMIYIEAGEQYQLNQLAEAVGLANEPQSAERLAQCLPSLNEYRKLCKKRPEPQGYGIRRFDNQAKQWCEVDRATADGLYAYIMVDGTYIHCYKKGVTFVEVPRDVGLYFWLSDQQAHLLQYDAEAQTLIVPRFADLPTLYARSATLCSGRLPKLDGDSFLYYGVSASVAYNITTKLNQAVTR